MPVGGRSRCCQLREMKKKKKKFEMFCGRVRNVMMYTQEKLHVLFADGTHNGQQLEIRAVEGTHTTPHKTGKIAQ